MTADKNIKQGSVPKTSTEKRNGVGENTPTTTSMPKWPIRPKKQNMNIVDIIDSVQNLFIYFIPGYISLTIINYYTSHKKKDEKHIVIISITLSFIITTITNIFMKWLIYRPSEVEKSIWYLIGSIVLGVFISMYDNDRIIIMKKSLKEIIDKKISPSYSSKPTVWAKAMKNGHWARIYLKDDNIAYTGKIIYYTDDPESEEREVLLCHYESFDIEAQEPILTTNTNDDKVLINCKDIKYIEILNGGENDTNNNEGNNEEGF